MKMFKFLTHPHVGLKITYEKQKCVVVGMDENKRICTLENEEGIKIKLTGSKFGMMNYIFNRPKKPLIDVYGNHINYNDFFYMSDKETKDISIGVYKGLHNHDKYFYFKNCQEAHEYKNAPETN